MKRLFALMLALFLTLFTAGCACAAAPAAQATPGASAAFELHVLNVGKADCLLIKCGDKYMMVDTGDAGDEQAIKEYLSALNVTRLEYLVATHPDKDHIGGAPWIVSDYEIGQAWVCPLEKDSKPYMSMMAALEASGVAIERPKAGVTAALGDARIDVLSPTDALLTTGDDNECSIVLRITYGNTHFLLMADAQAQAEQSMLASGADVSADVLKVGHHGSNQSTSAELLSAVAPQYAAISCGYSTEDVYPNPATIAALTAAHVTVKRTDTDGTIIFSSDGSAVACRTLGVDSADAGYILDSKTGVFHLTSCPDLPKKKRQVFYQRRADAVSAGGVPCPVCNP